MLVKSSWQKYGVYYFDLRDNCIYKELTTFLIISYVLVSKLRVYFQSNNLDAYIRGPNINSSMQQL